MSASHPSTSSAPGGDGDRRTALLAEIARRGVTHGTEEKPIVSRDGRLGTRWVMSFLGVALREPWLSDACDLLLDRLRRFEGKQLATMGLGASSLLSGCVMRSAGAYNGLIVRETAKAHGSGKQIEGLPDPDEPVVILDDAIGTGHSALQCARILEENGLEVEGVVCAVRFTYDSGFGLLEEHGYRVCALYDVHDDLAPILEPGTAPDPDPWRARAIAWSGEAAPDGLAPCALARRYLRAAIETGAMPRPPASLAMPLPCEGGIWVSLRRIETGTAVARMGFWNFPGETAPPAPDALAQACWMLAKRLPKGEKGLAWLDACGLALSVFGPLEICTPGDVDNARFGLVVRSRERPWVIGSALPDMPGIQGGGHQLRHAVHVNGRLRALEPFDLYRHRVDKLIEPGAPWPPGGVSRRAPLLPEDRDAAAGRLIARARALLEGGRADPDAPFLLGGEYLFLSLYAASGQVACIGCPCRTGADFDALVRAAAGDPRAGGHVPAALTIRLGLLDAGWSRRGAPPAFGSGIDALGLADGDRDSILLPEVAVDGNLDEAAFEALLAVKAGGERNAAQSWRRLRTTCWDEGHGPPSHPSFRVARQTLPADRDRAAADWAQWLAASILRDTLPESVLPLDEEGIGTAATDLRDAAIWRIAQAAEALGVAAHAVPRTPAYGLLHHRARGAPPMPGVETLTRAVLSAKAVRDARTEPAAFWLSLRALAEAPEIPDDAPFDPVLKRARRRLDAPALPDERLVRLAALCTLAKRGHAAPHDALAREAAWAAASISAEGVFITAQKDIEETLLTAQAAEALALAAPLLDGREIREAAERCLDRLVALSIAAPGGGAVVRSSSVQSGAHTGHTVAALGAWAAWGEGA